MQNHLLQLMCLTAMEKPPTSDPEDIRNEKVNHIILKQRLACPIRLKFCDVFVLLN